MADSIIFSFSQYFLNYFSHSKTITIPTEIIELEACLACIVQLFDGLMKVSEFLTWKLLALGKVAGFLLAGRKLKESQRERSPLAIYLTLTSWNCAESTKKNPGKN